MSIIDNSSNINKLTNNSLSTVSSSNTQGTASASPLPLVDTQKQELIKKLGITLEQYEALKAQVPNFDTLGLDKQAELINSLSTPKIDDVQNTAEQEEVSQPKTEKQLYNEKLPDEKIEDCYAAFAKNSYIYGIKDKNGNVIAQAHESEDAWNNLSDAEKQAEIEKIKAFIDKDERLKSAKDVFVSATEKDKNLKEAAADYIMRGIQTAAFNEVSYIEYLQKDEYERLNLENEYLLDQESVNKNNLNASDRAKMKEFATLKEQVGKIVSAKIGEDVTNNLDSSDVAKYMRYYNLDKTELMRNAILDKPAESRTAKEIDFIKNFQNLEHTRNKAKAQRLLSLKDELNSYETKLKNGEELSTEEKANYNLIKQYQSTDEAKNLEEIAKNLPKPENDYEKSVASEVENFQTQIKDFCNGSDLETAAALSFLETKTKGMPEKDKAKYLDTFFKFYNTEASVNAFGFYINKYKVLSTNRDHLDKQVNNFDMADTASANNIYKNLENLGLSDDPYAQGNGISLTITAGRVLQSKCQGEEHDDKKLAYDQLASKFNNSKVQTTAYAVTATIVSEDKQEQGVIDLQGSENATEELQIYAADNADKLKGKAQLTSLDIATYRSVKALKRTAENGIFSRLEKENQQPAMALEHSRLEERLGKEEAIKYSNMLADQIKDCHKDNQLAMHNEMMNSKYSEVQEHVAGNIKDYDPTVQTKALETVLASGNEKAIDAAAESIKYSPDCVKSEMAEVVAAYASNNAIKADSAILEQFADAIAAQNKTIQEKIASGQVLSESELSTLSIAERRDYLTSFFKKLPVDKKIKLLASMPDSQKKTVYTLIARTDSTLFNAIIRDKDRADQLLSMGLPEDVNNKIKNVVSFLAVSDIGYQNIAAKYEIEYDNDSNKTKNTAYTTMPQDFDTKEIYKKDKLGNILA